VYKKNQSPLPGTAPLKLGERPEFDLKEVLELVTDAFTGATERHIEVGDGLEMLVVEKGKEMRWITLRKSSRTPLFPPSFVVGTSLICQK